MDAYRAVVDKRDQRVFLDRPLPEESLRRILQAARMAGSSKNVEPNRLVVVRDRERLQALAALSPFAKFLARSGATVVIADIGIPSAVLVNRVIGFGYVDPARAAAPASVSRPRRPLTELVHWETW